MNNCNIISVSENAFRGLENTLQSLSLASNGLRSVPVVALRQLRLLSQLDLSTNNIKFIPDNAFVTLRLKTLKLAENNITISDNALRGCETSLKNLNLKGCQLKDVPLAVRDLRGVSFLDLAQNNLRVIEPGALQRLYSLTALNLERNVIQKLHRNVFSGVNDSLSSLSMLNNLLTEFPLEAIRSLPELRVSLKLLNNLHTGAKIRKRIKKRLKIFWENFWEFFFFFLIFFRILELENSNISIYFWRENSHD